MLVVDFQDVSSQDLTDRLHYEANTGQDSDNSGSFTMEVQEEEMEGETSTADRKATSQLSDISASKKENKKSRNGQKTTKEAESDGSIGGSASKPRLRTLCPYGKNCYRSVYLNIGAGQDLQPVTSFLFYIYLYICVSTETSSHSHNQ